MTLIKTAFSVALVVVYLTTFLAVTTALSSSSSSAYKPHLRAKIAHSIAKGERRDFERNAQRRSICDRCSRPPALCVCDVLPQERIDTATRILILQHPNERRKKNFSTIPLLRLVLKNVQVLHGYQFEVDKIPPIQELLLNNNNKGQKPLLLYPSPEAVSLDSLTIDETKIAGVEKLQNIIPSLADNHHHHLLVIVDGTWTEAKRMVRDSPGLVEACQLVQFTSESSSIYDAVRKEPEEHCLSTLEACAQALALLEPSPNVHQATKYLHDALQCHVDAHLVNAAMMAPRSAGAATAKLYAKNKRRREIERSIFVKQENEFRKEQEKQETQEDRISPVKKIRIELSDGAILRSLEPSDAPLVDSWWEYQSPKSLPLVTRRITQDQGIACLGIETMNGALIACIMRYEGGALGMLHVEEDHRRRGYGVALLRLATQNLQERGEERFAFIVDGNHASEALFTAAGWERENPAQKRGTGKRRAKRKWVHLE